MSLVDIWEYLSPIVCLVEIPIDENAYDEKLNSIGWIRILGGIAEFPGHKR